MKEVRKLLPSLIQLQYPRLPLEKYYVYVSIRHRVCAGAFGVFVVQVLEAVAVKIARI